MITKTKTKKLFPEAHVLVNKQILIKMAKIGEAKPSKKLKLGVWLHHFTDQKSKYYDEKFTKKIKKLRPLWLLVPTKEKNRQTQIKVLFKLIEILCRGSWITTQQMSVELSKSGYSRCHRTIKRLLRVLKDVNFNVLCKDDKLPYRYKLGKKLFLNFINDN